MGESIKISGIIGGVSEEDFDSATSGINNSINDLYNTKLDKGDYKDYTTAGLVTRIDVINNINGIISFYETWGYYDANNISQATTLKTFDTASNVNPHHTRGTNWKTEIVGIDIMTTNSSVSAGNQPLTIGIYEIARTGGVRGFQTGILKHLTTVTAPLASQFYRGEHTDLSSNPILLTPNFLVFVDVRHFGGWTYSDLYYKVYVKYTKII